MDECIICHNSKDTFKIKCNHCYCMECFSKMIEINPTCAYCRRDITDKQVLDIYYNSVKMLKRSDIKIVKNKIIMENAFNYLDLIENVNTLQEKRQYLNQMCKYLYENKYYIGRLNKEDKFLEAIISKLRDIYTDNQFPEIFEWYFKFRNYRDLNRRRI